jgi:hypothetical protein
MDIAAAVLLIAAAAGFVLWPLFAHPRAELGPEVELSPLERQKREAYAAIREAEFDHQMGKLTDGDLAVLREKYTRQALEAIAALEAARSGSPSKVGGAARRAEGHKPSRIAFCPACGFDLPPRANFCPACGEGLRALKEMVA